LSAPPDPLAAIGVPTSKGEGREGNGKREGRGWEGRKGTGGREGERNEGRGEEGGKGKDDLHPTLF